MEHARRGNMRIGTIFTDDNQVILHLCKKAGFKIEPTATEKQMLATLKL